MPEDTPLSNQVRAYRQSRGWSQDELSRRAGISRAAVSAIEIQRLVPSVEAALSLAEALSCRVEELFVRTSSLSAAPIWAWPPPIEPCRYWLARVGDRTLSFPVEPTARGLIPHDGVFRNGEFVARGEIVGDRTLVMASCDPAANLLAEEVSRQFDFRLIVLPRSSRTSLDLLKNGLVDVAGLHLATADHPDGNIDAVRSTLGPGFSLLTIATWQDGVAFSRGISIPSLATLPRSKLRWVGRESGSGARQCQDQVLNDHPVPRRTATDHRGVAEAIRSGWAEVGICLRLVSEEAGLGFLSVRDEAYDLCFRDRQKDDPRIRAIIHIARSTEYRRLLSELPGYNPVRGGEVISLDREAPRNDCDAERKSDARRNVS